MQRTGFELLQSHKNQFHNHWLLFFDEEITLQQLEEVCFSWIIQHEDLYKEKPLPTEPMQYPHTSMENFKQVVKAWRLGCDSRKMENKSDAWWLEKAKKFFLKPDNDYERGIKLFKQHEIEEEVPF